MAQRRMFSLKIIDTDKFLEMPKSSQLLYFHLSMRADDDGFVNNPKKIQKIVGCGDDDFKVLYGKQFVIPFESGICVIKDWKIHNYIQKDRYNETLYLEEKSQLKEVNNAYQIKGSEDLDTKCIQDGYTGKDRLGKVRLGKNIYGEFQNVLLKSEEFDKLNERLGTKLTEYYIEAVDNYIESTGKKYKSHYATILSWSRKDKKKVEATGETPKWFDVDVKAKTNEKEVKELEKLLKDFE